MDMRFLKFISFSHIEDDGHRHINDDAPDNIKREAKKLDQEHYEKTGRHMIIVDCPLSSD